MKCQNCNEYIVGKEVFCSNCGQKYFRNLSSKYILEDFKENILNFDSKIFRTLKKLIFKPGFLSAQFLKGKRTYYILPLKLYFTLSILLFFLLSIPKSKTLEADIRKNKETSFVYNNIKIQLSKEKYEELRDTKMLDFYLKDSLKVDSRFGRYFIKKTIISKYSNESFRDNILAQTSIFLLVLIPIISIFYKLIFRSNDLNYFDHIIFNIHFNSFVILLLSLDYLVRSILNIDYGMLPLVLISTFYLFIAIQNFYKGKKGRLLFKMLFLLIGYCSLALLFTILIFITSIIRTS